MATSEGVAGERPMPIAIIGMSCRLSGDVSTLDDFWTMLSRSRDGWRPMPEDRFASSTFYHPNPQKKGCFNNQGGYFMNQDLSRFDAPFFRITKQEAVAMDPQQRLLLECTYEALENAGITKEKISGSKTGVFVGGTVSNYRFGNLKDLNQTPMYDATGNHQSIQAGRLSYYFNLLGPAYSVDTACSSGLYALHQAVQSIRSGESESAVVAGCSLHVQPHDMVSMSLLGLLNEHGKTFAFDHRAKSGFARGEGVGALILKPLDQAIRDNDRIRSVIVNTGVNQDGRTNGLTNPSGEAQERLIRDVYARANILPSDAGFVEAHGTGTRVGDPIEAGSIYRVFGAGRTKRAPLYMGSVKANVGHLENASGIISVIKSTLMLEKGFILPNVNYEKANPAIPLDEWNIKVPVNIRPWPKDKKFISINSFGFGGSNAHAVLERPPLAFGDLPQEAKNTVPRLIVLSANDEGAAKRTAANLGIFIEQHPEVFQKRLIRDIAYTLGERRSHLPWRIALTAYSCDDLASSLNTVAAIPSVVTKVPKLAFVYTGQGAQWAQMGKELMTSHPIFADTVTRCSEYLQEIGADFSLLEELAKDKGESIVNEAHISQPICTAIQLGLTKLFASWGVEPSAVIGHSSGEIGAAFATGSITLENAMAVAYFRGKVAAGMSTKYPDLRGAMLAVGTGAVEVKGIIKTLGLDRVNVACENSPGSITASGDDVQIDRLAAELEQRSIFNRKLRVNMAYHSAHMQLVAGEYKSAIKYTCAKETEGVAFYSSLMGKKLESTSDLGPSYWVDNLTNPVLFSTALQELYRDSQPDIIVELGPHSALEGPIKQVLKSISPQAAQEVKYFPTLVRNQDATITTLKCAGGLFTKGHDINFHAVNQSGQGMRLPAIVPDFYPYPWSDHKYWFEPRSAKQQRQMQGGRHDLLGTLEDNYSEAAPTWRNILSTDDVPWLKDHRMQSLATFPLAGYVSMAVEAVSQRAQLRGLKPDQIVGYRLREVSASKALILDDGAQYETMLTLTAHAEGTRSYSNEWDEFRISSWSSGRGWLEHCRGLIGIKKATGPNHVSDMQLQAAHIRRHEVLNMVGHHLPLDTFYSELQQHGAGYNGVFKMPNDCGLRIAEPYSSATTTVPDTSLSMPSAFEFPSLVSAPFFDLLLQLTFCQLGAGRGNMACLFMPSAIKELELTTAFPNHPGQQVQTVVHGRPDFTSHGPVDFYIDVWQAEQKEPVMKMSGFRMTPVNGDASEALNPRSICYKMQWEPLAGINKTKESVETNAILNDHPKDSGNGVVNASTNSYPNGNGKGHPVGHANGYSNGVIEIKSRTNGHKNSPSITSNISSNSRIVNINPSNHNQGYGHRGITGIMNGTELKNMMKNHKKTSSTATSNGGAVAPVEITHLESYPAGDIDNTTFTVLCDKTMADPLTRAIVDLLDLRTGIRPTLVPFSKAEISSTTRYICLAELDEPLLNGMSSETFERLQTLLMNCASTLWVTAGAYRFAEKPESNIAQGLLRTIRSESGKVVATLDLDPMSRLDVRDRAELIIQAVKASIVTHEDDSAVDFEFAEQEGKLMVPRVVESEDMNLTIFRETQTSTAPYLQPFQQPDRRLKIAVGTYGALDSLYWKDEPVTPLDADEVEILVACTGMNFKDVVIAMGQVASPYLGVECSGTISRVGSNVNSLKVGDRVCAASLGAYSTYARCPATSATVIPDDMSFEVAASIPIVYCTAYYGIVELARMEPGESILIHAATGGVGQAAIQLAQMIGAEIFATVGSADKKQLLMDTYHIPEHRIFYSRDSSFGPAIREATGGKGVDVVVNSLAGDLLRETWECLAHFGRFIELGKRDITSNSRLEMAKFEYNCTFSSVDLTLVAAERPKLMQRCMTAVMNLLSMKTIQPIGPITAVSIQDVEPSLRKLQSGKTTGKLVVKHNGAHMVKAVHPAPRNDTLERDATYIIIGGTGGLGRSMAKRMVQRGARHIVLLSRSGTMNDDLTKLAKGCRKKGACIYVMKCDVADPENVRMLVEELQEDLPPIRGIIHAAMVLRDVLFERMSYEDYDIVVRSKISGAWNFHNALIETPLDFFVVMSSVAGIVGNRGQAHYAAANTFLDAFTLYRRRQGLPATSIDLAAVEGVGYLAENSAKMTEVMRNLSDNTVDESEVLALIESAISGKINHLCQDQCITGLGFDNAAALPYYASDAKFSHLRSALLANSADGNAASGSENLSIGQQLRRAGEIQEAQNIVTVGLRDKLGAILMLPEEVMIAQQGTTSITAFGLDSLNAIELRNWIGKELQAHLQVLELLTSGCLADLAGLVLRKSRLEGVWSKQE